MQAHVDTVYVYVDIYAFINKYIYVYIYMHVYTHVYMYLYTYIHLHTHTYYIQSVLRSKPKNAALGFHATAFAHGLRGAGPASLDCSL